MAGRILVIDDEPSVRRVVERMLTRVGYDVEAASSAAEAKERIETQRFELILCDLHLTDMSGPDVLELARAHQPDTARMLITGDPLVGSAVEAAGIVRCLSKPFTVVEMMEAAKFGVEVTLKNRQQSTSSALHLVRSEAGQDEPV
jgi:DNA-binding NtrC family response regulator